MDMGRADDEAAVVDGDAEAEEARAMPAVLAAAWGALTPLRLRRRADEDRRAAADSIVSLGTCFIPLLYSAMFPPHSFLFFCTILGG